MVSLNLNSLIGNISLARAANLARPTPASQEGTVSRSAESGDSFTRGQWWKNQAKSEIGSESDLPLYSRVDGAGAALAAGSSSAPVENRVSINDEPAANVDNPEDDSRSVQQGGENYVGQKNPDGEPLDAAALDVVRQLQQADTDVRAHEMAHVAAAGGYATGGASFTYQKGPDGKSYAVGGEVGIDMGKESSPDATMAKMRVVRQAALAPKDPSPQDQKVAAQATMNIAAAASELQQLASAGRGEKSVQVQKDKVTEDAEMTPQNRDIFIENSPSSDSLPPAPFKTIASYGQSGSSSRSVAGLDLLA